MRDEDRGYGRRIDAVIGEPLFDLPTRQPAVDKDALPRRFDEGTICFAA
jgi:hypothetical protein